MENITNHGKKRLKERVGVGKGNASKVTHRALAHGLGYQDCEGELAKWLLGKKLKSGAVAKIYGQKAYIFSEEDVLITVLSLPDEFEDLKQFVKPDAWERYIKYTNSFHISYSNNKRTSVKDNPLKDLNTIKAVLNRYLKAEAIDFLVIKVVRKGNTHLAYFVSDYPEEDSVYFKRICEWARRSIKVSVYFKHKKNPDGSYLLKKDYLS